MVYQVTPPPESQDARDSLPKLNGKTRLNAALKRAKQGGPPAVGQWMEFPGYTLSKTIAGLGSDWILIDCEHGNISDNEMYLAAGAISSVGCSPIIRVPAGEAWLIKRALDAGAHGIMVPMCETKEQVEAVVAAVKYPSSRWKQGIRGTGAMFAPVCFGQNGQEYLSTSNDNVVLIVQMESRKAIENCEEIAAVDGVDMLFVGPNDLAASMGYVAFEHASIPEIQVATAKVLTAANKSGKYAGYFCLNADAAALRASEGFHFMNCGADIVAITAWMSDEMNKLKMLLEKKTVY